MKNYTKENLVFFDCEWVPVAKDPHILEEFYPELYDVFLHQVEKWEAKFAGTPPLPLKEWWEEKAHLYPEFCKMITISYGYFNKGEFVIQSLYGENEAAILNSFNLVLDKVSKAGFTLCGYAIKRFDMPWLSKRMMINGIKPHPSISLYGKKPWEVDVLDLPEAWGQGSMGESYTPFELACTAMGIKSSKEDLSGSGVKEAYYKGEGERIKNYCEMDVQKTMELATKIIDLMP